MRPDTRLRTGLALGAIVAAGALLRLPGIGADPLWLDEANTVLIAQRGLRGIVDALSRDGNPPFFYLLLHGWIALFGDSEAAVRALPLAFGVACIAAVFVASRACFPGRDGVALAAAAFVAIGPLHVHYSQEARMYTLTPLLGVLALVALHAAQERGGARRWAALATLLAAGLYTHNYFVFVLGVGPAAALLAPGPRGRRRDLATALAASLAALLAYAPWIPILREQSASGVDAWIGPFFAATPPAAALLRSFEVMGVGGAYPRYLLELGTLVEVVPAPRLWLVARIAGALLAAGLVALGSAAALRERGERAALARIAVFAVLPLALAWVASLAITPVYLVGRYEMVSFTGFALLAARGLGALAARARTAAVLAGAVWIALAALVLGARLAHPPQDFERGVAAWLREVTTPADAIVFPGYTRTVAEYYLRRWNVAAERRSFPAEVASHLGWFDAAAATANEAAMRAEARALGRSLAPVLDGGGRVYLVADWTNAAPAVFAWLREAMVAELGAPAPSGAAPGARAAVETFAR